MNSDRDRALGRGALGSSVVAAERLRGGVASRMTVVRVADGREAVLRQLVADPWRTHAEALLTRERDVHGLLADSGIPVPRTLAVDVTVTAPTATPAC